jgi:hypothetical protein
MEKLEVQAKKLEEEIKVLVVSIEDMKRKEGEHLLHIDSVTKESTEDKRIGDRSAFLNLLYLKTIEKESNLSSSRTNLRNIQRQLTLYQITLGNLEEYKTEMVGEIKNTVIESNVAKKMKPNILVVAIASLIISLFIVFLMEYIEESKLRRKGKLQG